MAVVGKLAEIGRGSTLTDGLGADRVPFEAKRTMWGVATGLFPEGEGQWQEVLIATRTPGGLPVEEVLYVAPKHPRL